MAQQGQDTPPRYVSTRLVFVYMMLASVVLFENYSASYTSFLSVINEAKPFENIDQLEKSPFTVGAQMGTAYQNMFLVKSVCILCMETRP